MPCFLMDAARELDPEFLIPKYSSEPRQVRIYHVYFMQLYMTAASCRAKVKEGVWTLINLFTPSAREQQLFKVMLSAHSN